MEQLKNFIIEFINRFVGKTPTFFKVLRNISIVLGILASIMPILGMFDIQFNLGISLVLQKIIAVAAFVAALVSQLTQETPVKADMPFTVTAQQNALK